MERAAAAWRRGLTQLEEQLKADQLASPPARTAGSAVNCQLVAMLHIAKTGGVSVREWMLRLERHGRAQYLGPVTWMTYRGRFCSHGRYLHCCHILDKRPASECDKVRLTEARAEAIRHLATGEPNDNSTSERAEGHGLLGRNVRARAFLNASSTWRRNLLTMLEFHWPDSATGRWGDPYTFLQMFPAMRPQRLPPGCRIVVATLLRNPVELYPSLHLHLFPSMRTYNKQASSLTPCDYDGFIAAFPNFQSWRLTSSEWSPLPLSVISHDAMLRASTRLLSHFDVVGVTNEIEGWLQILCSRAGIVSCPPIRHLNAARRSRPSDKFGTLTCNRPNLSATQQSVEQHALADLKLYKWAKSKLADDMRAARFAGRRIRRLA